MGAAQSRGFQSWALKDESWETKEVSKVLEMSRALTNGNEGQDFLNGRKSMSQV